MLDWFTQNGGTLLVSAVVLLLAGAAAWSLVKGRRKGKPSCGCGCSHCAMHCGGAKQKSE